MTQLSISEARSLLTKLASQLNRHQDTIEVTSRGKPVLAILPWELYEALEETVEILGDEGLQAQLKASMAELKRGDTIPWAKAKKTLG